MSFQKQLLVARVAESFSFHHANQVLSLRAGTWPRQAIRKKAMARASFVVRSLALACLLALGACAAPAPAPAFDQGASVTAFAAPGAPQRSALPCTSLMGLRAFLLCAGAAVSCMLYRSRYFLRV